MYIHVEIMQAMAKIQKKHDLTKTELVAEMGQAIHVMLVHIEPGLKALIARIESMEAQP